MASRKAISSVLLLDLYGVGFSSTKTPSQNTALMNDTVINAVKESISTEDLLDVIVPSEIVSMSANARSDYETLINPVFEQDSIRRDRSRTVDHRTASKSILAVKNILDATNQGNSLTQTILNYAAFIQENTNVSSLTGLGNVKQGHIGEAMIYLDSTNPGWGI